MPRKKAVDANAEVAAGDGEKTTTEPRRSSRIKDIPKPETVAKKPAKPRAKKTKAADAAEGEGTTKKAGTKRKAAANGAAEGETKDDAEAAPAAGEEPPAKKVC